MRNESEGRRPNRLAFEKSPYLLQHANNPVDWYPWGPEAFEKRAYYLGSGEDMDIFYRRYARANSQEVKTIGTSLPGLQGHLEERSIFT